MNSHEENGIHNSALYCGHVMHHRFFPVVHRFIYRVFSVCIDLDELDALNKLRFFSVNKFNLFSFFEKDHAQKQEKLARQIRTLLSEKGYSKATVKIKLLCYPRVLGYVFNPLSVYFCYNDKDKLEVILYEVSNTFGSRHTYVLEANSDKEHNNIIKHSSNKLMYVSPFMPMDNRYHFRMQAPNDRVSVCIRQVQLAPGNDSSEQSKSDKNQALLHATFTGKRKQLSDRALLSAFFRYPLMSLKVMLAIHWQALKLWKKGLRLQPRTQPSTTSISWQDKDGLSHYESM
ncbi:DUF1365 domain-containing protein [Agaribacterium sp. ZY112]|uniref:DUF1365 domain-containing protein n=1 Tax=Agaribacterium sp. ZY112 TaxID=3233574 RepID=UPI003524E0CE